MLVMAVITLVAVALATECARRVWGATIGGKKPPNPRVKVYRLVFPVLRGEDLRSRLAVVGRQGEGTKGADEVTNAPSYLSLVG